MVGTNDPNFGQGLLGRWGDKYYDRVGGGRKPAELAPNYRISEPQAAVAAAQLTKHDQICGARTRAGGLLTSLLESTPGLRLPTLRKGDTHTYWFYVLRLEAQRFTVDRDGFVAALTAEGVACSGSHLVVPVYRYPVFQNHNFFAGAWPIRDAGLTQMDYRQVNCPTAEAFVADSVELTINEAMDDDYIRRLSHAIRTVAKRLAK
jgi:dTDP-4-amino-4,6-dideoxygalactose transaminase